MFSVDNILCLFLLFCSKSISSANVPNKMTENDKEIYHENNDDNMEFESTFDFAMDTCKINERATDQEVENVFKNILPVTMTEKCFIACWLEYFHVIQNGRFRRNQYIKLSTYGQPLDEIKVKLLKKILQECKVGDSCKAERCELAYLIVKCVYDGAIKHNIDPKEF